MGKRRKVISTIYLCSAIILTIVDFYNLTDLPLGALSILLYGCAISPGDLKKDIKKFDFKYNSIISLISFILMIISTIICFFIYD